MSHKLLIDDGALPIPARVRELKRLRDAAVAAGFSVEWTGTELSDEAKAFHAKHGLAIFEQGEWVASKITQMAA